MNMLQKKTNVKKLNKNDASPQTLNEHKIIQFSLGPLYKNAFKFISATHKNVPVQIKQIESMNRVQKNPGNINKNVT